MSEIGRTSDSRVFNATWCRCVGATWTVELRPVDYGGRTGPVVEWMCSGVPTEMPVPADDTIEILAEWGLRLFPGGGAGERSEEPRIRTRIPIGYVTRDPEVIRLALMLADLVDEALAHPMVLAAQWIEYGYAPDTAVSWVNAGVVWPAVAQTLIKAELQTTDPHPAMPGELTP